MHCSFLYEVHSFVCENSAYDMESYFTLYPKPELLYREEFLKTPVSSTNETDRQDIAEILLKVALKHPKPSKPNQIYSQTITHMIDLFNTHLYFREQTGTYSYKKYWWGATGRLHHRYATATTTTTTTTIYTTVQYTIQPTSTWIST